MLWAEQTTILERVAAGDPLGEILTDIVRMIELQDSSGMLCSLLLVDEAQERVLHGAAPSLPDDYVRYLDGLRIGPTAGSCGTAAYRKERVIVEDIASHPYWAPYRDVALSFGLRACWSTPILSPDHKVIATFAMYYREPRGPSLRELSWVDAATHLTAIAIGNARAAESLRRGEARARNLARLYAMANTVNEAMVHERDGARLYELVCRIAVDHGLARLAWIGIVDEATRHVLPAAQAGLAADYVEAIDLDLGDPRMNRGPAAEALRTGAPAITDEIERDDDFFWKAAASAHGLRSCAVFPMRSRGRTTALLAVYAGQPGAFGDQEITVLSTLADDIAFAVDSARTEAALRRAEAAVRAGEHLRALIYDCVADVVFYLSVAAGDQYRFESVNRAFFEATGLTEPEVIGRMLDDVIPAPSLALVKSKYAEAVATCRKVVWEEVSRYRTGVRYGEVTVCPIVDAQGRCTHLVGTVHDVTARRDAELERRQIEAQLHQAQRLQALGTLSGGVAHDFNNLLAAIHGNLDLTLQDLEAHHPARESVVEIKRAAVRASDLVRQILMFSRRAEPRRELVELRPLVEEALALLSAALKPRVRLRTAFANDVPPIRGDATQIHQCVVNLVTNAAHAIGDAGGVIDVTLEAYVVRPEARSDVPELAPGVHARLAVTDDGCGMSADTLRRVFEPFFTTRPAGEGTGLGLSVVHGILKSHHGAVAVRSGLGEGTTFELLFPAASPAEDRPEALPAPRPQARGRQRVLFVDNDEALVFLARRAFARLGHQIAAHTSARDALRAYEQHPSDFDIVVTDVSMPELDGPSLIRALRQISSEVKVVMTSGCLRPEDVAIARELGVDAVFEKPQSLDDLARLVVPMLPELAQPA